MFGAATFERPWDGETMKGARAKGSMILSQVAPVIMAVTLREGAMVDRDELQRSLGGSRTTGGVQSRARASADVEREEEIKFRFLMPGRA
jgi:hypothetical protein